MANTKKVNDTIDLIMKGLIELKQAISEDEGVTSFTSGNVTATTQKKEATAASAPALDLDLEGFEALKKALESDKWPEAVNPNLICDPSNENDKLERGRGIVELMIEPDLKGLKVLDMGCGEGHVAYIASEYEPLNVVGYDIKENDKWKEFKKDGLTYTTNFNEVLAEGPFNVIVMFDVLDHVKGETPIELLKKAKDALAPDGQIYMRCHPFTSKHATHLYHYINKAFVHLVFSENEIKQLIKDDKYVEENIGVTAPMKTYESFIQSAGLTQVHRREITSKVDPFFKIPRIAERVMQTTKFKQFPEFQMGLDFIDYVLKK
jgi:2-polyprenyl-3-methyl-5-hydroxy-6-metoxy-1,4-benzoquinol methylase